LYSPLATFKGEPIFTSTKPSSGTDLKAPSKPRVVVVVLVPLEPRVVVFVFVFVFGS
jgi:hypothetical protein